MIVGLGEHFGGTECVHDWRVQSGLDCGVRTGMQFEREVKGMAAVIWRRVQTMG